MRLHFEDGEREALAARLGIAEDADDNTVAAAVANWIQQPRETEGGGSGEGDGGGSGGSGSGSGEGSGDDDLIADIGDIDEQDAIAVDVAEYARLRRRDQIAARLEEADRQRDRDELIEEAIADGKFSPARRAHYRDRFDSDADNTRALIARLQRNSVPLEMRGIEAPTEGEDSDVYPSEWVPEVQARTAPSAGASRSSRVHAED